MRYAELGIKTRREAPTRARTPGEALLVRAGYLREDRALTSLGERAIERLRSNIKPRQDALVRAGLPVIQLEDERSVFPGTSGELELLRCLSCGYVHEADLARARKDALEPESALPLRKAATPHCDTIEALAGFLGIETARTGKAMMYSRATDGRFVFVLVRGDMQVSSRKLREHAGDVRPATVEEMSRGGAVPGYASPMGLRSALVVVDDLIPLSPNLVVGANEPGYHLLNANFGRDFSADIVGDVTLAHPGDPCSRCGDTLNAGRATLIAEGGSIRPLNALLAFADVFRDEKGLRLPRWVAPFELHVVQLGSKEIDTRRTADDLHRELQAAGVTVLCDDRDERPGVKFMDADLIGCPLRLTVGEKNLRQAMVEFKRRDQDEITIVKLADASGAALAMLRDADA